MQVIEALFTHIEEPHDYLHIKHASPNMTGHYAHVHDATIRDEFDRYQSQRVNVSGQRLGFDPETPTASAEWGQAQPQPDPRQPSQRILRPPRAAGLAPPECPLTCPDY